MKRLCAGDICSEHQRRTRVVKGHDDRGTGT
jgi:hypothetical protein